MNFDRIVPYYDWLAAVIFLGAIKKSQIRNLKKLPPNGSVLIIGGGTGWIIPYIFLGARIDKLYYLEASHKMLEISKKACPKELRGRVEFILGDETRIPELAFDVIITNFFLDCFGHTRLDSILILLHNCLKTGGYWYFTDFRIDKRWYQRMWQIPFISVMIRFFRLSVGLETQRLVDLLALIESLPFESLVKDYFAGRVIVSGVYRKNAFESLD